MPAHLPLFPWLAPKQAAADHRPFMSILCKMFLLPVPFAVATGISSLFWYIGQITNWQFLAGLTAVLAYPMLLGALLLRLMFPIRYRPLLNRRQKLVSIPLILTSALLAGWLWVTIADQHGSVKNPLDLCWWCGVISVLCMTLAFL